MRTEAMIAAQKRYYEKNKSKFAERSRDNYLKSNTKQSRQNTEKMLIAKNRLLWDSILQSKGMNKCQLCGYDIHFSAIEFHHINPDTKKYQFNNMYRLKPTEERILEVDKCIAVCANCHRLIHNNVITISKDLSGWHKD